MYTRLVLGLLVGCIVLTLTTYSVGAIEEKVDASESDAGSSASKAGTGSSSSAGGDSGSSDGGGEDSSSSGSSSDSDDSDSDGSGSSSSDSSRSHESSGIESSLSDQSFESEEEDNCWQLVAVGDCTFSRFMTRQYAYHRVPDNDACRSLCEQEKEFRCYGYNLYGRGNVFHCQLLKELYSDDKQDHLESCADLDTRYWKFWQNVCPPDCDKSLDPNCGHPTPCEGTASNPKCCNWALAEECVANGGTCRDDRGPVECQCPCGQSGPTCGVPESKCCNWAGRALCEANRGTCSDVSGMPVCQCPCGREGLTCETPLDKCCSWPRLTECIANGGACSDASGVPTCSCPCGRVGVACETRQDKCCNWGLLAQCVSNGGRCDESGLVPRCVCPCGRIGATCEIPDSKCCNWDLAATCVTNGGRCDDSSGFPTCVCPCGQIGVTCEFTQEKCCNWNQLTECVTNGGRCVDDGRPPSCVCPCGQTGPTCGTRLDKCCNWNQLPECVANGGRCVDDGRPPSCICPCGQEGPTCGTRLDKCCNWGLRDECVANGGRCDDSGGSATCICPCGQAGPTCGTRLDKCCNWDLADECTRSGNQCSDVSGVPVCQCGSCQTGPTCQEVPRTCLCQDLCTATEDCFDTPSGAVCSPKCRDSTGAEFTLMFLENRNNEDPLIIPPPMEVYVSSADIVRNTTVRVFTLDPDCPADVTVSVPPRTSQRVEMPACIMQQGSGVGNKAIRVVERNGNDLVVYGINKRRFTADGFLALPDAVAGSDYTTASFSPADDATEFGVVALQPDTRVTITLPERDVSVNIFGVTYFSGSIFTVDMSQFQTLQVQSVSGDLTGTRIQMSKPGHAYSGNIRVSVPSTATSRDHLVEQLLSTDKWGREFVIVAIPGRPNTGEFVRVVTTSEAAEITVYLQGGGGIQTNGARAGVNPFSSIQIQMPAASTSMYIVSNVRVSVFQYTVSLAQGEEIHDPSMITIVPINLFANAFVLNTPLFTGGSTAIAKPYRRNILLLVAENGDRAGILLDGLPIPERFPWTQVPQPNRQPDLYTAAVDITHGNHLVYHPDNNVKFMAYAYGADDQETYGFPLKLNFDECVPIV